MLAGREVADSDLRPIQLLMIWASQITCGEEPTLLLLIYYYTRIFLECVIKMNYQEHIIKNIQNASTSF